MSCPEQDLSLCMQTGPIYWASKLQTEIVLSTAEAEYIALSQSLTRSHSSNDTYGRDTSYLSSLHQRTKLCM